MLTVLTIPFSLSYTFYDNIKVFDTSQKDYCAYQQVTLKMKKKLCIIFNKSEPDKIAISNSLHVVV